MITPTLDHIEVVKEDSQLCGEFLEWLMSKYYVIDKKESQEQLYLYPASSYINIEKLLAEFFGVDLSVAESEKQQILKELQTR